MTFDLIDAFGLGPRELVAFTGGGGKTSLLLELSRQLAGRGDRVLMTTTTKLGLDQTEGAEVCWSIDWYEIESALDRGRPVFVLSEADDHKVLGYDPEISRGPVRRKQCRICAGRGRRVAAAAVEGAGRV